MKRAGRLLLLIGGVGAALRLGFALRRLLFPVHEYDAGDLLLRWQEVQAWFAGRPVYGVIGSADYPPASYLLFWPFLGWTGFATARWIWAASTVALLFWLVRTLARETGPARPLRTLLVLLPLIGYASYSTIVNGQVTVLVVTLLLAGLLTLTRKTTFRSDVAGSGLIIAALIKPTLSVPLVWIAILVPRRVRPAVLILTGYAAMTVAAAAFQNVGVVELFRGWLAQSDKVNLGATGVNLQGLLTTVGFEAAFLPSALALALATGWWVHRHRTIDVWLLAGVASIVALFWTYHRPFDDLLLLLPATALLRVADRAPTSNRKQVALVLAWMVTLLAVAHPQLRLLTHGLIITDVETIVFALDNLRAAAVLFSIVFLIREAHLEAHPLVAAGSSVPARAAPAPIRASISHDGRGIDWVALCFALPLLVLAGAYLWLALDHGRLDLWGVSVHESGTYTLGETVFYTRHFLREIPTLVAVALFVMAAAAGPAVAPHDAAVRRWRLLSAGLLGAAALMVVAALAAVAVAEGPGEAARNLMQSYTRDDIRAYGSHWRFHLLSTLWFAFAVRFLVGLGGDQVGTPPVRRHRPAELAAWGFFIALTAAFGPGLEPFTDPRFLGHQAREIFTHGLVTLPLCLGVIGLAHRRLLPTRAMARPRVSAADMIPVIAIPLYLGAGVLLTNAMESGQTAGGLSAMVAAHFFEHALDYVLVALLVAGGAALRITRLSRRTVARAWPARSPAPVGSV